MDVESLSLIFGIAGTFILLYSPIKLYVKNIKKNLEYSVKSQLIGFIFLFNSFMYSLLLKSGLIESNLRFSLVWIVYLVFIVSGVWIALKITSPVIIKWGKSKSGGIDFELKGLMDFFVFYLPLPLAVICLFKSDLVPMINIFIFCEVMGHIHEGKN
ncbi:hypothetical protein COV15_00895 [Candidatus Woesearchaeota archaeon CG10_big_fil_rev_8_21_14_0_10_34_12]|nr:MAG: hypothetical protein COV15_00895 [Candidatus Woesearchaeota archaeon CG10_big_fil_rev_8_21_14_0_10_34_12]